MFLGPVRKQDLNSLLSNLVDWHSELGLCSAEAEGSGAKLSAALMFGGLGLRRGGKVSKLKGCAAAGSAFGGELFSAS